MELADAIKILKAFRSEIDGSRRVFVDDEDEESIDTVVTHYDKSEQLKCELDRWYYSCKLYNINKGCKNCEHYKKVEQKCDDKLTEAIELIFKAHSIIGRVASEEELIRMNLSDTNTTKWEELKERSYVFAVIGEALCDLGKQLKMMVEKLKDGKTK